MQKNILSRFSGIFGFFVILQNIVLAQVPPVSNGGILPGPSSAAGGLSYVLNNLLPAISNWVVAVIMASAVIVVIIGGIMYVFSAGEQETQKKARDTITWGIVGMVLAILSYTVVKIIVFINFFS